MGCGESKEEVRLHERYRLQLQNADVVAAMDALERECSGAVFPTGWGSHTCCM